MREKICRWTSFILGAFVILTGFTSKGFASAPALGLSLDAPAQAEAILAPSKNPLRQSRIEAVSAFSLGKSFEREGFLPEALSQYQAAGKADPSYFPTHIREASILYQLKRSEEALAILESLRASGVDVAQVNALLGLGYLERNETSKAEAFLKKALAQSYETQKSQDSGYYLQLAALLEHLLEALNPMATKENVAKVEPLYQRAAKLEPRNPAIWSKLGDLHVGAGDAAQAARNFETAYVIAPDFPKLREKLSLALLSSKEPARAIPIFEELVRLEPQRTKLYSLLGELYYNQQNLAKSEDYYLLALQLDQPATPQAYLRVAYIQLERNKPEEAKKWLLEGEKKFPHVPHLPLLLGLSYRKLNQLDKALAAFTEAEKEGSAIEGFNNSNFYFEYGVTYERKEDIGQAVKWLEKSIVLDPKNHKALNYLGYLWADRGERLTEAHSLISQALSLNKDNPAYLDSLGWVYYKQGQTRKAKAYLEKALKQIPDDSTVCEHMGDVYQKLEEPAKALSFWKKALAEAEKPELLKKKIESLSPRLTTSDQAQEKVLSPPMTTALRTAAELLKR